MKSIESPVSLSVVSTIFSVSSSIDAISLMDWKKPWTIKSTLYPPKIGPDPLSGPGPYVFFNKYTLVSGSDVSVGEEKLFAFELEVCDILLYL